MTENLPAIQAEIASIQSQMGTRAYRGDEVLQSRYRALINLQSTVLGDRSGDQEAGTSGPLIPLATEAEFRRENGAAANYGSYVKLSRLAADFVLNMPATDQAAFVADFDALPDEVGFAALAEISGPKVQAGRSSPEAVEAFSKLAEGSVLVPEWGGMAAMHHASVRERLWRIVDRIEEERNAEAFLDWHAALPPGVKVAIYRKLVS